MTGSFTLDRRNKLAQLAVAKGNVKVGELAVMFGVTTETIRKDLIHLEKEGIVIKGHGGAISSNENRESPYSARLTEYVDAKTKIAQAAVDMIPENGVVFIDAGSTTESIARLLTLKKGLTIITNSAFILPLLYGVECSVYSLGGKIRSSSMAMVGMWAINAINSISADIAFIGTNGFLKRNGPCTTSYEEAEIKKEMINNSKTVVVVCDNRKFESDSTIQFCDWSAVDYVITDNGASEEDIRALQRHTQVIVAK